MLDAEISPRPWGCFLLSYAHSHHSQDFPTPVGVFPCEEVKVL